MNKQLSSLCVALVALGASFLIACSGTTGNENNTVGIIDYLAFERNGGDGAFLMNLEGDIIELPENLLLPSASVNGIFSAFDKETNLYYFFKTEQDPKPISEGYKKVGAFTGKYAPVVDAEDQLKYINRSGKEAFSVQAKDAGNFFCERALFCADDGKGGLLWGYFNEEGYLIFNGREGDVINKGGFKISCTKIENALCLVPDVVQAVVLPYGDADRGQEAAAFVICDGEISRQELRQQLKQQLMQQEMPKRILFLKEIPLNSRGKTDKKRLLALL